MEQLLTLLPILLPLVIIELGMRVFCIIDIIKLKEKGIKTRWDNPLLWIILVAVINFAWVFYLVLGKEE